MLITLINKDLPPYWTRHCERRRHTKSFDALLHGGRWPLRTQPAVRSVAPYGVETAGSRMRTVAGIMRCCTRMSRWVRIHCRRRQKEITLGAVTLKGWSRLTVLRLRCRRLHVELAAVSSRRHLKHGNRLCHKRFHWTIIATTLLYALELIFLTPLLLSM